LTGTVTVTDGVANRFVIPTTSTGLVDFMVRVWYVVD